MNSKEEDPTVDGGVPKPKFSNVVVTTLKNVDCVTNTDDSPTGTKRKFMDIDDFIEEEMFRLEKKKKELLKSLPVFTGQINVSSPDVSINTILKDGNTADNPPLILQSCGYELTETVGVNMEVNNSSPDVLTSLQDAEIISKVTNPGVVTPSVIITPLEVNYNKIVPEIDSTKALPGDKQKSAGIKSAEESQGSKENASLLQNSLSESYETELPNSDKSVKSTEKKDTIVPEDLPEKVAVIPVKDTSCATPGDANVSGLESTDLSIAEPKPEIKEDETVWEDYNTFSSDNFFDEPLKIDIMEENDDGLVNCIASLSSDELRSIQRPPQSAKRTPQTVNEHNTGENPPPDKQPDSTAKKFYIPKPQKNKCKFKPKRWTTDEERKQQSATVDQPPPTVVTIRPPIRVLVKSLDPLEYVVCTEDGLPPQFTPVSKQSDLKPPKCDSTPNETDLHDSASNEFDLPDLTPDEPILPASTPKGPDLPDSAPKGLDLPDSTPKEPECVIPSSVAVPSYLLVEPKNPWEPISLPDSNENEIISKEEKLIKYFCENKLAARSIVENHLKWLQESNRLYYTCPHCDMKLFSKQCYDSHMYNMHQCEPKECEVCGEHFETVRLLEMHVRAKHSGNIFCQLCKLKAPNYKSLLFHMVKHPTIINKCSFCDDFKISETVNNERYKIDRRRSRNVDQPLDIDTSRNIYNKYKAHLKTHMRHDPDVQKRKSRFDHPSPECEVCCMRFESEAHYMFHKKVAHKHMSQEDIEKLKESRKIKLSPEEEIKLAQKEYGKEYKRRKREELKNRNEEKERKAIERQKKIDRKEEEKLRNRKIRHQYRDMTYNDIKERLLKMIEEEENGNAKKQKKKGDKKKGKMNDNATKKQKNEGDKKKGKKNKKQKENKEIKKKKNKKKIREENEKDKNEEVKDINKEASSKNDEDENKEKNSKEDHDENKVENSKEDNDENKEENPKEDNDENKEENSIEESC